MDKLKGAIGLGKTKPNPEHANTAPPEPTAGQSTKAAPSEQAASQSSVLNTKKSASVADNAAPAVSLGNASAPTAPTPDPAPEQAPDPIPEPALAPADPEKITVDNLWKLAYKSLKTRDPDLVTSYETRLNDQSDDPKPQPIATEKLSDVNFIKSKVETLEEQREDDRWQITLWKEPIVLRGLAEKLVKVAIWSDTIVKEALSTQPHAALAWCGATMLLPLLGEAMGQHSNLVKGFHDMAQEQIYWQLCDKTSLQGTNEDEKYQDFLGNIVELYSLILEYQAKAICHLCKGQLYRAWADLTESDWTNDAKNITEASEKCKGPLTQIHHDQTMKKFDAEIQLMSESKEAMDNIFKLLTVLSEKQEIQYQDEKATSYLKDLESEYEAFKNESTKGNTRVEGTCEWLFKDEKFNTWRRQNDSAVLWVAAGPGRGKTILSSSLIDERRLSFNITTSMICHFFFKDGDKRRNDSTQALRAILHQIYIQDPTGQLIGLAMKNGKPPGRQITSDFEKLWAILQGCVESPHSGEIIILIDALDECVLSGQKKFLKALKKLYATPEARSSASKLKFIITSRPDSNFSDFCSQTLGPFPNPAYIPIHGDDKSTEIGVEIERVIKERLNDLAISWQPKVKNEVRKRLINNKDRTYLWLDLVFEEIEAKRTYFGGPGTFEDHMKEINNLPEGVPDAYGKALDRSEDQNACRALLQIILAATRPLSVIEANYALKMATHAAGYESHQALYDKLFSTFDNVVRSITGGIINVYDGKVSFLHQTVKEFLTIAPKEEDPTRSKWQGSLSTSVSHVTLATACVDYLLLPEFNEQLKIETMSRSLRQLFVGRTSEVVQHSFSSQVKAFPFLLYASRNWAYHYSKQVEESAIQALDKAKTLCDVLNPKGNAWTNLYGPYVSSQKPNYDEFQIMGPILVASTIGLTVVVKHLLTGHEDLVNNLDSRSRCALSAALEGEQEEVVKYLMTLDNVDVNIGADYNESPFSIACYSGYDQIVDTMIKRGKPDTTAIDVSLLTPLLSACFAGCHQVVDVLLKSDLDLEFKNEYGQTALMLACDGGSPETVNTILDWKDVLGPDKIDVNERNHRGQTALVGTVEKRNLQILNTLLKCRDVDVNLPDLSTGKTPLMTAVNACKLMTRKIIADDERALAFGLNELKLVSTLLEVKEIGIGLEDYTESTALTYALGDWRGDTLLTTAGLICYADGFDLDAEFSDNVSLLKTMRQIISSDITSAEMRRFRADLEEKRASMQRAGDTTIKPGSISAMIEPIWMKVRALRLKPLQRE
jgi:hypothetical protein